MKPKNDAYYGTDLFDSSPGIDEPETPRYGIQDIKIVDAVFFDAPIVPDGHYYAMRRVAAVPPYVANLSIDSRGHLVYQRSEDVTLDFEIQNGSLIVSNSAEESEES